MNKGAATRLVRQPLQSVFWTLSDFPGPPPGYRKDLVVKLNNDPLDC